MIQTPNNEIDITIERLNLCVNSDQLDRHLFDEKFAMLLY